MKEDKIYKSEKELITKAKFLEGKRVSEVLDKRKEVSWANVNNKGKFGQIIENEYFGIQTNNRKNPDFKNLNIELKVSGLKNVKGKWTPKERISLGMINSTDILNNPNLKESQLWSKIRKILFIWYEYDKNTLDRLIRKIELIDFNIQMKKFVIQLERDYKKIYEMFKNDDVDKLSEGLTVFLGAARKGSGGEKEKKVISIISDKLYYSRVFTIKIGAAKIIYNNKNYVNAPMVYDDIRNKVNKYKGLTVREIAKNFNLNLKSKNVLSQALPKIIGYENYSDFEKTNEGYRLKIIPLTKNRNVKESFKINKSIISNLENNLCWEDTDAFLMCDYPYIALTTIQRNNNDTFLDAVINSLVLITFTDDEVRDMGKIYNEILYKYRNGGIKSAVIKNKYSHIRPSGKNNKDIIKTFANEEVPRFGIWFNAKLIEEKILKFNLKKGKD